MRPSLPLLFAGMATALPANEHNKRLLCSGKPPAFFLAGDSTTAIQSSNGGGWGNGFISFLRSPAWGVNYGHNGATTVSFVAGGNWDTVLGRVREAKGGFEPYVTIQVCCLHPSLTRSLVEGRERSDYVVLVRPQRPKTSSKHHPGPIPIQPRISGS